MRCDTTGFPIDCNVLVMSQNFAYDMMSLDRKLCRATDFPVRRTLAQLRHKCNYKVAHKADKLFTRVYVA